MNCPQCGVETQAGAVFCHRCGASLKDGAAGPSPAQPAAAAPPQANAAGNDATARFRALAPSTPGDPHDVTQHVLWEGGYSPKAMMGTWLIAGTITIAAFILGVLYVTGVWWWVLLGALVLLWAYLGMTCLYHRWSVHYRLTPQRFFHEHGILRRITDRIEVIAMDDVTVVQGPLDHFFGTGRIEIISSDRTDPTFVMIGVDNVKYVADLIDEARRAERNRRGVRVESI